jgi:NAD-dependent DNA ligase
MALVKKKKPISKEPEWQPNENSLIECPVAAFLVYSYLYYKKGISVIDDHEFDAICRHLINIHDTLTDHPHFAMVTKEALEATSLFNVDKYPTIIESIGRDIQKEIKQRRK